MRNKQLGAGEGDGHSYTEKSATPYGSHETSAAGGSMPVAEAGNLAVQRLRTGGEPLAITRDGRTAFHPRARRHPRLAEIAAHEAVHRAQFTAEGKPRGSTAELEADAGAGAHALLAGRSYAPAYRAGRGEVLAYEDASLEDEAKSFERLGAGASKTAKVEGGVSRGGGFGQPETTTYHLQSSGSGERGSLDTTTDIVLRVNPEDVLAHPRVGGTETTPIYSKDPHETFPIAVTYTRTIDFTDLMGRTCAVEVTGVAFFSRESFAAASRFGSPTPHQLLTARADQAVVKIVLRGKSWAQNYSGREDASGNESLAALADALGANLGQHGNRLGLIAKVRARFVEPEVTAGEQFDSLYEFLTAADNEVIGNRVMDHLKQLGGGTVVTGPVQKGKPEPKGEMPWWAKGIALGALAGFAIVGAILAVAAIFSIPVALAAAAVFLTLGSVALIYSFKRRYEEAELAGGVSIVSVFSAAVLDVIGVSEMQQAITDRSILTGRDLNRSWQERVSSGVTGLVNFLGTAYGAAQYKPRVGAPDLPPPTEPSTPSVTPNADPWAGPVPDAPPTAVTEPPAALTPAASAKTGGTVTVWKRKATDAPRQQPAKIDEEDIGHLVDEATSGTGTARRSPSAPEELGGTARRPEVDDPHLQGPQRLWPEPSLGSGAAAARERGLPSEIVDSGYVYTRDDLPDVVPETGFGGARPASPTQPLATERGRGVAGRQPTTNPDPADVQNATLDADLRAIEDHIAMLNRGRPAGSQWTLENVRINRTQVAEGATGATRASTRTRPDLQFTIRDPQGRAQRFLIEYDRSPPTRALDHARGILERDPTAIAILKVIGFEKPRTTGAQGAQGQ